ALSMQSSSQRSLRPVQPANPSRKKSDMTDYELEKINAERRLRRLPMLTRQQATSVLVSHPQRSDNGFDSFGFLIGYETGVGYSPEAMLGSMFHHTQDLPPSPSNDTSFSYGSSDPTPSYTSNDTSSSSSSDYSSSSSDSSSSSSSS